ncbi:hypothetical protein ABVK25_003758 [Lepraria finkii]|uniref:Uncharacterized protein n=1 Tax=Lepraria finkii TaxID=1340010 RepID=A0ABR4BEN2_9LECA
MHRHPRLKPPPIKTTLPTIYSLPYQSHHLPIPPCPKTAYTPVKHNNKWHYRDHIGPKQLRPLPPEPVPTPQPQQRTQHQDRKHVPHISTLQLQYPETGGGGECVLEDCDGEGVREVVECETE